MIAPPRQALKRVTTSQPSGRARELQKQEERLAVEASGTHPRPTADALN